MSHPNIFLMSLFFATACFTIIPPIEAKTKTQSLRYLLTDHFNETRNNNFDPDAKRRARDFIVNMFTDHGLYTWTEEFQSNQPKKFGPGVNIIGQLPGRYTGTRDDKIVLIGAHYDTVQGSPGVDDNGSGMTALLQALKLHTNPDKLNCSRAYTILFVAFDLEENQQDNAQCDKCSDCCSACPGITCGSYGFVLNFTRYLNSTGVSFQGAFILDTVMNFDNTPNSQKLPDSHFNENFPDISQRMQMNKNRGNFLAVIGRSSNDGQLIRNISMAFDTDENFLLLPISLPFSGEELEKNFKDIFRSDQTNFWEDHPTLPAVFMTDTADLRGYMKNCYHEECDNISHVTPEMLVFLSKTADSLAGVAKVMTSETCQSKRKDCGQLGFTETEGQFTTPYYDTQYPNNLDCAWTISVDAEQTELRLNFTAFDLEESVNCTADYVEIRDGSDNMAPLIAKYCGKALPKPVKTSAQSLYIMFHTDELDAFKGFKAEWSSTKNAAQDNHMKSWEVALLVVGILLLCLLMAGAAFAFYRHHRNKQPKPYQSVVTTYHL